MTIKGGNLKGSFGNLCEDWQQQKKKEALKKGYCLYANCTYCTDEKRLMSKAGEKDLRPKEAVKGEEKV